MTKSERKEFFDAWLEAELIITTIEPNFVPEKQFRRPEESGPKEIKLLLQFLRVQVKMFLHDKESTEREKMTLANIVDQYVRNS